VTVLDAIALVMGGAVASVHVRGRLITEATEGAGPLVALAFAGLSLTSAGPFLLGSRRLAGWPYPERGAGLWYWAALGLPWDVAGLVQAIGPGHWAQGPLLVIGLSAASLFSVVEVWSIWIKVPPREGLTGPRKNLPWTDRVGLVLAVAWPLQYALLLMFSAQP
jgi:hypothetical protein